MQEILEVIDSYGIDTVVLALIINVLTGIVKIPIKHLSTKLEPKGIHLNKYITLLPIVLGFSVSALATGLVFEPGVYWNAHTPVLALTSAGLSLSIYAICEKFFGEKRVTDNTANNGDMPVATETEQETSADKPAARIVLKKQTEVNKAESKT